MLTVLVVRLPQGTVTFGPSDGIGIAVSWRVDVTSVARGSERPWFVQVQEHP